VSDPTDRFGVFVASVALAAVGGALLGSGPLVEAAVGMAATFHSGLFLGLLLSD